MSELNEVVKINLDFSEIKTYHLYDKLFEIGVTQVTEKWHDLLEPELILEGDFTDEAIALCFYQHCPMMYLMQGSTTVSIDTEHGQKYTTKFTRA